MILPRGLIVSCQAREDNPLHGPGHMAAMARAAEMGGAVAIRANGPDDIAAICAATALPVIGIHKVFRGDEAVYITPTIAAARAVIAAGARVVAFDVTDRPRTGDAPAAIMAAIHAAGAESFADVATLDEGLAAAAMGANYVSTTLSGYTEATAGRGPGPDLDLVAQLSARLSVAVVAEGRFNTPELARAALDAGAHAVVVGTMITNPAAITRAFAAALTGQS
jgi:putative N-acetylmannosamine-6-phosphate epimerase